MRKTFLRILMASVVFVAVGTVSVIGGQALAAGSGEPLVRQAWPWDGLFGRYDKASLQRGFQVYRDVCSACHGLDHLAYRNLGDIGFTEEQIKQIAAEKDVTDGPDDEGEMFLRPARPADRVVPPYANAEAARAAQAGGLPPDLSLIVKARAGGADYVANLLQGYVDEDKVAAYLLEHPPSDDFVRNPDLFFNRFFASGNHQIAMSPPLLLAESMEYADGTEVSDRQVTHDIVSFLAWAADPHLERDKDVGVKVLLFLAIMTVLLYALMRRVWKRLDER